MSETVNYKTSIRTTSIQTTDPEGLYNYIDKLLSENKNPVAYEILTRNVKPYMDYDKKFDDEGAMKAHLKEKLLEFRNRAIFEYFHVFESSGYDKVRGIFKVSLHAIARDGYYKQGIDMVEDMKERFGEIDESVYKRGDKMQLMRLPYCVKEGDDRILQYIKYNYDTQKFKKVSWSEIHPDLYREWLISVIGARSLIEPPTITPPSREDNIVPDTVLPVSEKLCEGALEDLVNLLEYFDQDWTWEEWRDIVWNIRGMADEHGVDLRYLAHDISRESSKYNERETNEMYDAKNRWTGETLKTGSWIRRVKACDPKGFKEWNKKWRPRTEQRAVIPDGADDKEEEDVMKTYLNSDMTWYEFQKKFNRTVFDNIITLRNEFQNDIKKVMFKCIKGDAYVIRVSEQDPFYICRDIPDFAITYTATDGKGKTLKIDVRFKSLCLNASYNWDRYIPIYSEMTFMPKGISRPDVMNRWGSGFKASLLDKDDIRCDLVEPILDFIKKVWCGNDDGLLKYIISWFQAIFRKPFEKTKRAIVLYSEKQQVGKGVVINKFLIPYIFGSRLGASVSGLDKLTGRFNSIVCDKLLINCDELSALEGGNYHDKFDTLKKLITDPTVQIELKYRDTIELPDFSNYIFCTNNHFAVKIEPHDSRYVLLECSDIYRGKTAFFDNLVDNVFTQEAGDAFFSYCYHYEDSVCIRDIPMTQYKKEAMIVSMSSPRRFLNCIRELLDDHKDGNVEGLVPGTWDYKALNCENMMIGANVFYSCYENWCNEAREKILSKTAFGLDIKKFVDKKKSHGVMVYDLNTISFQ